MRLWELDLSKLPGPLGTLGAKELHVWLGAWLRDRGRRRRAARATANGAPKHLLFSLCDHYEPLHGNASLAKGIERVDAWRVKYPQIAARFRDSTGRGPKHSFFFPGEQYDPKLIDGVAELVAGGHGDVEVHLHHDGDTRETLRASLEKTLADLDRHGLVPKLRGKHAWAFIHGNWCLANARRDGRWCGVDDEMELLYELGCYADFTFPSAPDESQPGIVNAVYYPMGDVTKRRAYEKGARARVGTPRQDRLLLIEGPIAMARRPGKIGLRIESGALDGGDPPTAARLRTWLDQRVTVDGKPEWVFVKVHTHGAPEKNAAILLGDAMIAFHEALAKAAKDDAWQLHYVTARETYNVARAAMDGKKGSPAEYFDYEIAPAACARSAKR